MSETGRTMRWCVAAALAAWAMLSADSASADPPPASQPSAVSLLDTTAYWLGALADATDPPRQVRAAQLLGARREASAVEPLLATLAGTRRVRGQMRVLDPSSPAGGQPARVPPTSQPSESVDASAQAHALRIGSSPFLAELLAHPRADQWRWVRRRAAGRPPADLVDELAKALSAAPAASEPVIDLDLAAADPAEAAEMLNLLMAIYQKRTETRFKQRVRRLELDKELADARNTQADAAQKLKDFLVKNDFDAAKLAYQQALKKAEPLVGRRDDGAARLKAARKALENATDKRDDLNKTLLITTTYLEDAKRKLDDLLSHPTEPREPWQHQVDVRRQDVRNLGHRMMKTQDALEQLERDRDRAQRTVNKLWDDVDALERQIKRVMDGADDRYHALVEQGKPLAAVADEAQKKLDALSAESAELPSISELLDADDTAVLMTRARSEAPPAEPIELRRAAATALGMIGERRAAGGLIDQLASADEGLKLAAAAALLRITGENFGADQARWRAWLDQHADK